MKTIYEQKENDVEDHWHDDLQPLLGPKLELNSPDHW